MPIQFPVPKPFLGTETASEASAWLRHVDKYFKYTPFTNDAALALLDTWHQGDLAADWFASLLFDHPGAPSGPELTEKIWREAFEHRWNPASSHCARLLEWEQLRQGYKSFDAFAAEVTKLRVIVKVTEEAAIAKLLSGISRPLAVAVAPMQQFYLSTAYDDVVTSLSLTARTIRPTEPRRPGQGNPRISEEEKAKLINNNGCFYCRVPNAGHSARNCPTKAGKSSSTYVKVNSVPVVESNISAYSVPDLTPTTDPETTIPAPVPSPATVPTPLPATVPMLDNSPLPVVPAPKINVTVSSVTEPDKTTDTEALIDPCAEVNIVSTTLVDSLDIDTSEINLHLGNEISASVNGVFEIRLVPELVST